VKGRPLAQEGFVQTVHEALQACLDRGMRMPFIVALVALNGSVSVWRYARDEEAEILVEHMIGKGFEPPINVMIVDAEGEATRVVIAKVGEITYH